MFIHICYQLTECLTDKASAYKAGFKIAAKNPTTSGNTLSVVLILDHTGKIVVFTNVIAQHLTTISSILQFMLLKDSNQSGSLLETLQWQINHCVLRYQFFLDCTQTC